MDANRVEMLLAQLWDELTPPDHTGSIVLTVHGAQGAMRNYDTLVKNIAVTRKEYRPATTK